MNPTPYITRRARGLAPLNRRRARRRSRWITAARLACVAVALLWLAALASLAWLVIR
jgi:hypothetical protein